VCVFCVFVMRVCCVCVFGGGILYIYIYIYIIHTYIHTYICTYTYWLTQVETHTYISIHTYIYIYMVDICIYTYIVDTGGSRKLLAFRSLNGW
jgi:hypothetical protein